MFEGLFGLWSPPFFLVLALKPSILDMIGKLPATEPHPKPSTFKICIGMLFLFYVKD